MIEVVSLRTTRPAPGVPTDVVVDRRTPLGNPYVMRGEWERGKVCALYKEYFRRMVEGDGMPEGEREPFMAELARIGGIYRAYGRLRLFCWCAPLQCHAQTIREYLYGKFPIKEDKV